MTFCLLLFFYNVSCIFYLVARQGSWAGSVESVPAVYVEASNEFAFRK